MSIKRRLARLVMLDLWGWRVTGPLPYDTPRCLVVIYPHTSNWDFPVGILFRAAFGVEVNFAAKDSLFRGPFGWLFRVLGGKPVVRARNTKFVDAVADTFRRQDVFRLCVTPEGTRGRVETLKTGFHHIARVAGVPIVFCAFDWANKDMRWYPPFHVDDSYARTIDAFHETFRGVEGCRPRDQYPIPAAAPG